jgi:16S rRNA (guanine1516-N2)-methyltransferase
VPKTTNTIAVAAKIPELAEKAAGLAARLEMPLGETDSDDYALVLEFTEEGLQLRQTGPGAPGPIRINFTGGRTEYRRRHGGGRKETLVRAMGIKGKHRPTVLDGTAGLGRDAFVLACQGCKVEMLERNPVIAALLEDGLRRAGGDPEIGPMVRERMSLRRGDSLLELARFPDDRRPEVVYLDPMYPHRDKSALVKKEMRILRTLVGDDEDSDRLLSAALTVAIKRVVVKRPATAPPLPGSKPDLVYETKSHRFDVYLTGNRPGQGGNIVK